MNDTPVKYPFFRLFCTLVLVGWIVWADRSGKNFAFLNTDTLFRHLSIDYEQVICSDLSNLFTAAKMQFPGLFGKLHL